MRKVLLLGGIALASLQAVAAYTQLESIKSDGNVWIYSGYKPQCTDRIEVTFKANSTDTAALYCARGTTTSTATFTSFLVKDSAGKFRVRFDRNGTISAYSSQILNTTDIHTVVADGNTLICTYDGNYAVTMGSGTFTPGSAFAIFGSHTQGSSLSEATTLDKITNRAAYTLYSFKVYSSDGTLILDLVPARDENADSGTTAQYGLFDRVSKTYHRGLGTGAFVAGAQVGETGGLGEGALVWNGGASVFWSDAANWSRSAVPADGDAVAIPAGKTAVVTNTTAQMEQLMVSGTLSCSNWTTCVKADTVMVANGGKVTVAGLSTDSWTNRVWIVCNDCAINAGGSIDVNDLGFRGSPQTAGGGGGKASYVSGPGKGNEENRGASHGGHGAYSGNRGLNKTAFQNRLPYDDPQKPVLPGSGGFPQAWGPGTDGGGAVYISAAKSVTVNGSIKASVTKTVSYRGTCGSGGAVLIECETFHGKNGSIAADGGGSSSTTAAIVNDGYHGGAPGGGGCIAVKYGPTKQTEDMITNLTMSVASGYWNSKKAFGDENERMDAGLGTLYFPDNKLLKVLLASGLSGALVNCSDYTWNGDLVFGKGHLRLASEGVKFKVDGNLTVTGKMTRLEIGGVTITNQCTVNGIWAGRQTNILEVTGAVTIEKYGRLDLHAAETNKNIAIGAYLKVGGRLSVATNSTLSCWSDQVNMGSPFIAADSFLLAEGGLVTGYMRGCGPGKGIGGGYQASGGSHGGRSGYALNNQAPKKPYDDEYLPVMPGSGGANGSWAAGGPGGGVVYISVAKDATVNGTINVDGMSAQGDHTGGAGAGGTIQIRCGKFAVGPAAVFSAKGGDGKTHKDVGGGSGGGGGRIAIWCGGILAPDTSRGKIKPFAAPEAHPQEFICADTNVFNVAGGIGIGTDARANTVADPGTIRFVYVCRKGMQIILR